MCDTQSRGELAVAKMCLADAYVLFVLPALRRSAEQGLKINADALEVLDVYQRALKLKKVDARTQIPKKVPEAPHASLLWEPPSMGEIEAGVASVVENYEKRGVHDPGFADAVQSNAVQMSELMDMWRTAHSPEALGLCRNWHYNPVRVPPKAPFPLPTIAHPPNPLTHRPNPG